MAAAESAGVGEALRVELAGLEIPKCIRGVDGEGVDAVFLVCSRKNVSEKGAEAAQ